MKMDLKTGIIEINGEIIMSGYTFEDFRNTKFYKGQDGIRIIRINDTVQIGKNKFIASFFFRNKVLYMISIICVDVEIPFSEEINRKNIHDNILKNNGLAPESFFDRGNIKSVYDPKGNVCSINIIYNAGM